MRNHPVVGRAGRLGAAIAASAVAIVAVAPAAFADTSQSKANAVTLGLVSVTSGLEFASNPGGSGQVVHGDQPALSILGSQKDITAGALQQIAVADGNGVSAACAGLIGNGALIQVGNNGLCGVTGGQTGGVTLGGPLGVGVVDANAIVETCAANSSGFTAAGAELIDATILGGALKLPINPPPNDNFIPGVLELNVQTTSAGTVKATALEIPLLGLAIGNVTCGPNAKTSVTSVFPLKSLPIVFGTVAILVAGGLLWWRRRSRRLAGV